MIWFSVERVAAQEVPSPFLILPPARYNHIMRWIQELRFKKYYVSFDPGNIFKKMPAFCFYFEPLVQTVALLSCMKTKSPFFVTWCTLRILRKSLCQRLWFLPSKKRLLTFSFQNQRIHGHSLILYVPLLKDIIISSSIAPTLGIEPPFCSRSHPPFTPFATMMY